LSRSLGEYDVAIVGAGPNGLSAAAYLARAGASVMLLERRFERGGTFATDDYSTPFQYNLVQLELPLGPELPPYRELELEAQGIRFVEPALPFAARTEPRGEELCIGRRGRGLGGEVERMLAAAHDGLAPLLFAPPRPEADVRADLQQGEHAEALTLVDSTPRTLADRAADPRAAIVLRYACALSGFHSPDGPLGLIGAFDVARRFWPWLVAGGTKNLANALFRVAVGAGARGLVSSEVERVERAGEGFRVLTTDARELRARAVISTLDPVSTFEGLLADEPAAAELRTAAASWRVDACGPFTAHFGIRGDPPAAAAAEADALVRVFGFAEAEDVTRRFDAAARDELAEAPAGHLTAASVHDPLLASPGPYGPLHVLRVQAPAPFELPDRGWDRARTQLRRACWDAAVAHFDGLDGANLLFEFCDTPLDIASRFVTTRRGSPRQGALVAEQTLDRRPHPTCSSARTPVEGFYVGGGAVHPGVPGSLGGGVNAARAVAEDLKLAP
jgi:phytoene dehydrogenase-like protein